MAVALVVAVGMVALVSSSVRAVPRCPNGLVPLGPRCCGAGQTLHDQACAGAPQTCGEGMVRQADGCVALEGTIVIGRGSSSWRPPDDQLGTTGEVAVAEAFAIDRVEVTWARYRRCVAEGHCVEVRPIDGGGDPGQAVSGITLGEARAFCVQAGGRLPRDAEWLRLALGEVEKRYPWGDPDAFCLRASYGLVGGPCGEDARGPDTAGARPWGATPAGVLDVAGNVAELVEGQAPEGSAVVRGGSFLESESSAMRARWRKVIPVDARLAWVGFRCAYAASATP